MNPRTIRRLLSIGVAVTAMALAVPNVLGYNISGRSWKTNRVYYYVNPQNHYVDEPRAVLAIQDAAAAWTLQTNAAIELVYAGYTSGSSLGLNYKNEVFFRNEAGGGYSYTWWDSSGKILDFDIILYEGSRPFFTGTSGCQSGMYIEDLATHEFGHGLGISHSSYADATMYPTTTWCLMNWRTLSSDDIAAVQTLYPAGSVTLEPPAPPSQLSAGLDPANPTTSINLSWSDNSTNENGFLVYRSASGGSYINIGQVAANARSYNDGALVPGSAYSYRLAAYNESGASGYSNSALVQTQAIPPPSSTPSPISLSVRGYKVKGLQKAELIWSGLQAETVDVYRDEMRMFGTANDGSVTDHINGKGGGSYRYRVCAAGTTTCSATVTLSF